MDYITANEAAEKWGFSVRWVQLFCKQGRVKGYRRLGRAWVIPDDAEKPIDGRLKENWKEGKSNEI